MSRRAWLLGLVLLGCEARQWATATVSDVRTMSQSGQIVSCSFRASSPLGSQTFVLEGIYLRGDMLRCAILRDGDTLPVFKTDRGIAFRWRVR